MNNEFSLKSNKFYTFYTRFIYYESNITKIHDCNGFQFISELYIMPIRYRFGITRIKIPEKLISQTFTTVFL